MPGLVCGTLSIIQYDAVTYRALCNKTLDVIQAAIFDGSSESLLQDVLWLLFGAAFVLGCILCHLDSLVSRHQTARSKALRGAVSAGI